MKSKKIAIILPTTLKIADYEDLKKLASFENSENLNYGLFMATDEDDNYDREKLSSIFQKANEISLKKYPITKPPRICKMWRELAKEAYEKEYDFFLLLGDDVEILGNWYEEVINSFENISKRNNVPFGVGCVCIKDITSPNFPTFPIVNKSHIELFGEIFPEDFVNQDADPYLYELYRKINCTEGTKNAYLINKRGGVTHGLSRNKPIYEQIHVEGRDDILKNALNRLKEKHSNIKDIITMDIIIPCFRIDKNCLDKIISIEREPKVDHRFIIVVDKSIDDISPEKLEFLINLEKTHPVRVRVNEKNMGASFSRNRGMQESYSEGVLYLDDDVLPDEKIVKFYTEAILTNPEKDGFVGKSILTKGFKHSTDAVHMAQTSFFGTICDHFKYVPGGVTANLLVKRHDYLKFGLDFPKTGGGEDIDFCLKLEKWPLVSVPEAVVTHPGGNDGKRLAMWKRFFKGAKGDGLLINKYPQYTFRTLPNVGEGTALTSVSSIMLGKNSFQYIPVLWCADFASGALGSYYHTDNCPYLEGFERALIALESNFSRNASEFGHIVRHLSDGRLDNLTKRFDGFCGLYPEGINYEKNRAYFHNAGFLSSLLAFGVFFR